MSVKIPLNGLSDALRKIADDLPDKIEDTLLQQGMRTYTEIIRETPVDMGILRAANQVETKREGSKIILSHYNDQVYASVQHEREDFNHRLGKAKYIIDPVMRDVGKHMTSILRVVIGEVEENGQ